MDIETLKREMDKAHYVYDDSLITTLYVALKLGRPLLIEGAAGVGKTEIAKVMADALGRELVRMQCYEGLDESKTIYEWNYQKQLLSIQVNMGKEDSDKLTKSLFSDEYLLERPLLKSIRSEQPVVLLIDEMVVLFQELLLDLYERGVLLCLCSRNDPSEIRNAFLNPQMLIKEEHFVQFIANRSDKVSNINLIANNLNLSNLVSISILILFLLLSYIFEYEFSVNAERFSVVMLASASVLYK